MKSKIKALKKDQSVTLPFADKQELQRIRNYCHELEGEFRTRATTTDVTVTRIDDVSKDNLSNKLRKWKVGKVGYIDKKIGNVSGVIASIGAQDNFVVRTVTRVEKVK